MNAFKGWVTTIIGIVIISLAIAQFFGFIDLPHPSNVQKPAQLAIAFFIGLALIIMPAGVLEEQIKKVGDKLTNRL